ncbi:MAG TPA: sugar phosphate nucleotidyltransferase [Bryobacteraceae bacterium]|nr:sugar phosphate nucleotidyltransferase [Bryobacteraceae bacterium]
MLIYNPKPWAVILAGGDGTRLQSLTRFISGDTRPKQFCPIFGDRTLLAETRARLRKFIPPERTLFVVQDAHQPFYRDQLADVNPDLILSQPANKGTAVAIAFAIGKILARDREATVAVFPADHYYNNDGIFLAAVERSCHVVEHNQTSLTLLGVEAYSPETEYGWIEPEFDDRDAARVLRFWEKPSLPRARELLARGCLWNTFVMIGKAGTFADMIHAAAPGLTESVQPILRHWTDPRHRRIFSILSPVDFSHNVLALETGRLLVLPLRGIRWSDLGKPERVIETLAEAGIRPRWVERFGGLSNNARTA